MKKLIFVLVLALFANFAHAANAKNSDDGGDDGTDTGHFYECYSWAAYTWTHPLTCTFGLSTTLPLITTFGAPESKEAYVSQLRDDSAEFVAADGFTPASALLQNAINTIRAQDASNQGVSDLEIARAILK